MSALLRFFTPLRYAAAAFFKRDLAVRRDAGGMHIVLESIIDEPAKVPRRSRPDLADGRLREEQALILQQLAALLDEQPETRQTLRHLVFVEQALAKKGLRALHKLPLDVLQRALDQLEGLVTNWSPVGLANLRSKMAVAILDREHHDPEAETEAYRTAAVMDTMPLTMGVPEVQERSDDEALAAAYAALGSAAPTGEAVEMQGELGSRSARAASPQPRGAEKSAEIPLRELHT
jgi:hypothetical protein